MGAQILSTTFSLTLLFKVKHGGKCYPSDVIMASCWNAALWLHWTHPDNSGNPPISRFLVISAKSLLPSNIHRFHIFRSGYLWGGALLCLPYIHLCLFKECFSSPPSRLTCMLTGSLNRKPCLLTALRLLVLLSSSPSSCTKWKI